MKYVINTICEQDKNSITTAFTNSWTTLAMIYSTLSTLTTWGALVLLCAAPTHAQNESSPPCEQHGGSHGPVFVTSECIDEIYDRPLIDSEVNQTTPAPRLWVSGHFDNTSISFNFYLPPLDQFDGRFFQFAYPTQSANATTNDLGFGLDSRAYTVQVTGTSGYRAEAAAAKFSKAVAQKYYGKSIQRLYGYLYGGSGGSFQTVGSLENTKGVWDGAVAIVQGIPVSTPDGPAARAMAGLVLYDKSSQIQNAIKPGGSGNPYSELEPWQQDALREVTYLGVPIRTWEDFNTVANRSTLYIQAPTIQSFDPTYSRDFWTQPGYLGTEPGPLGDLVRKAVVNFNTTVRRLEQDGSNATVALELSTTPPG